MSLGVVLLAKRKKIGMSQEELAAKLGVARVSISQWENEKYLPDCKTLIAMSKIFNCSIDELVRDKPNPTTNPASARGTNETA